MELSNFIIKAEIVETTFSFPKFWIQRGYFGIFYPETTRNDFYISGTQKEMTVLKKRIF